jgi:NTE family protein
VFDDGELTARYRAREVGVGGDIGYAFGRRSELRLGYEVGRADFERRIGDPLFPDSEGKEEYALLQWLFDDQDSSIVPTRGLRSQARVRWFRDAPDATERFRLGELRLSHFWSLGEKQRLFVLGEGGTSFHDEVPTLYQFTLGGPLSLSAYDLQEFRGNHVLFASLGYLRVLGRLPDFVGGPVYVGGWVESGSAFDQIDMATIRTSVSAGVLLETALGPVFFGGSVGDEGSSRIYFTLGRLIR